MWILNSPFSWSHKHRNFVFRSETSQIQQLPSHESMNVCDRIMTKQTQTPIWMWSILEVANPGIVYGLRGTELAQVPGSATLGWNGEIWAKMSGKGTYLYCGHCSVFPTPELSPGSSGNCHFPGGFPFWGVAGILVYEAESFTLAIHFSNPINYNKLPMELGLELSPDKAHLGRLEDTYTRIANGIYSSSLLDIKFDRGVVGRSYGTVQVSNGPVKVTATMSCATHSLLKVALEEQRGSGEETGTENACRTRQYQEK
ncbi:hypothetical protein HGM15179_020894 [Zosterops borbonicus]|uniref:Uncharacterized protein n=1 Tax=Zosterops borbonicus TaxID=364589 RepID=A0A8K1D9G9_9PASS|nr:hypothetical protein HGM15179_020894 [Zosterops borbonicus]